MIKSAAERGDELLNSPPARNEEALVEWIGSLKTAKRDLYAELNDPRTRMGDRKAAVTASVLSEVEQKLLSAEAILDRVRNEIPQTEMVETESGGNINIQASVENLAIASAASTIGRNNFERFANGIREYEEKLEPYVDPRFSEFPRERYAERLKELIAMRDDQLAKVAAEAFPTDEWIGKKPAPYGGEGDLGHIPTHFEKDPDAKADPEDKDTDGQFEDAIAKERKFRGIEEASKSGKEAGKKTANLNDAISKMRSAGMSEADIRSVIADLEHDEDIDFSGLEEPYESRESFSNTVTNDAGETRFAGKTAAQPSDPDPGSHEPASSADGGAQMQAKPPEPEEAWETTMLESGDSSGAPRGPNRRLQKDVPAYSTPAKNLTSALKLVSMYDNMTEEQALAIVKTVYANDDSLEDQAEEEATGSGEEATEHDVVKNEDSLEGLFDE